MTQPWLTAPTLRLAPVSATPVPAGTEPAAAPATPRSDRLTLARVRELVLAPGTALAVMVIGLALLFVWPTVGLPFVALAVLPAVVYHLQSGQRVRLRRARR